MTWSFKRFRHTALAFCVTKEECSRLLRGTWRIIQEECRKAPSEESKICSSQQIESIASAEHISECVHVKGDLVIRVNSQATADELEQNLGQIEEIDGYLKIYRSYPLTSLEFLKNLKVIHGETLYNDRYALVVYENPSLQKLWDWNTFETKIENGSILFHYNSQLCVSEIQTLAKLIEINYTTFDVSPYSNGDKKACNYVTLNITITELTSTDATFAWENVTFNDTESLVIGYLFYYIEDPFQNVTIYSERDECDENNWNSIFVSDNTIELKNLNAHAQYAYYIKTYVTLPAIASQTKIDYFTTLSDDPSNPTHVETKSSSSDSITVSWNPPEFPNGEMSYYAIVTYFEKDDLNFLTQRNYCDYPHHTHVEEVTKVPEEIETNSTDNTTCSCKGEKISKPPESMCDRFEIILKPGLRYSGCRQYMYSMDDSSGTNSYESISNVPMEFDRHKIVKRSHIFTNSSNVLEMNVTDPNSTSYEIKPLKHFSMYVILLKGCNTKDQCSGPEMVFQRTLRKEGADNIPSVPKVEIDHFDATIKWIEPKEPNSLIVAYYVEHKRTDLEHSIPITECITQQEYVFTGNKYRMRNFLPGHYSVRVKAVSLAGTGQFSEVIEFEISLPSHALLTAFLVVLITIVVLVPIAVCCYYRHKKKNTIEQLRLLANINSSGTESDYIEDEWEMERDDVEMFKELGQGSFGMVYSGFIKSQNRPCAIKTINEKATTHERMIFLHEASTMKSFSNTHHVVKLLGVVSRGQPPLVVMELMARGDLKSFLRQSRSSSGNITCIEMYRMSGEIADGMLYLTSKKFVHRDLAARNCMVSADHTIKIGDFGMTRDIYETDYYRKEAGGLMPIRWMSPESLADGVFTSDSDAWSYGVVLWEIVTLAEQPYQGLANEQVLQFVTAQGTLERPPECPDLLYEIMEACWKWRPSHRPQFKDIVEKLESHIGQHFRLVSFYHSSEGEEYRINPRIRVYNRPALTTSFSRDMSVYWDALQDDFSL